MHITKLFAQILPDAVQYAALQCRSPFRQYIGIVGYFFLGKTEISALSKRPKFGKFGQIWAKFGQKYIFMYKIWDKIIKNGNIGITKLPAWGFFRFIGIT